MRNLNNFNAESLDSKNMKEIKGGFPWCIPAAIIGAACYVIFEDWDNFKKGVKDA